MTPLLSALLLAAGTLQPTPPATSETFALVIGWNRTDDPTVSTLRYADDDAVQHGALFSQLGAQVVHALGADEEARVGRGDACDQLGARGKGELDRVGGDGERPRRAPGRVGAVAPDATSTRASCAVK